jgi:3-methylfumaryl-CoA hydratase
MRVSTVSPGHPAQLDVQAWIGRKESTTDTVTPQLAERLSATIESKRVSFAPGDELPRGWYSVLFPRVVPRSQIGGDGHPALGDFLPPVALPKRMFAGKRITFSAPIVIGDSLERVSEIVSVQPKQGSSGALVFVTVRHTISNAAGVVVVEEQDVVYREAASGAGSAGAKPQAASPAFSARYTSAPIVADPVMIFRYSALSFNGHRIHYDHPYVTQVEGYPALVVNGGLSTLCAIEHLYDAWGGALSSLTTRNTSPLFAGEPFHVESAPSAQAGGVDFRVVKEGGKAVVVGHAVIQGARS